MNQDLSIIHLILNASWVVQAVVALLVGISIASWAAIFSKIVALRRVAALNDEFDRDFWSGTSHGCGTSEAHPAGVIGVHGCIVMMLIPHVHSRPTSSR